MVLGPNSIIVVYMDPLGLVTYYLGNYWGYKQGNYSYNYL